VTRQNQKLSKDLMKPLKQRIEDVADAIAYRYKAEREGRIAA